MPKQPTPTLSSHKQQWLISRTETVCKLPDIDFQFGRTSTTATKRPLSPFPMLGSASEGKRDGTKMYFFMDREMDATRLKAHIYSYNGTEWEREAILELQEDGPKSRRAPSSNQLRYSIEFDIRTSGNKLNYQWFRLDVELDGAQHPYYYFGKVNRGNREERSLNYLQQLLGCHINASSRVSMEQIHQKFVTRAEKQQQQKRNFCNSLET